MEPAQMVSAVIAAGSALIALLAYFKFKPGQRERVDMDVAEGNVNVAQGTLNIAQGSIQLVTATLEAQFKRMDIEMEDMRREHATYRDDTNRRIAEMAAELRGERAEKVEAVRDNRRLIQRLVHAEKRVSELEAEVAQLKVDRGATP